MAYIASKATLINNTFLPEHGLYITGASGRDPFTRPCDFQRFDIHARGCQDGAATTVMACDVSMSSTYDGSPRAVV